MAQIDRNQFDYLTNLSKGNDGNAIWAKAQLQGASVAPVQNAAGTNYSTPQPTGSAPATQTGQGTYNTPSNNNGWNYSFQQYTPNSQISDTGLKVAGNYDYYTGKGVESLRGNAGGADPTKLNAVGFYTDQMNDVQNQIRQAVNAEMNKGYGVSDDWAKQNLSQLYKRYYDIEDYTNKTYGINGLNNMYTFAGSNRASTGNNQNGTFMDANQFAQYNSMIKNGMAPQSAFNAIQKSSGGKFTGNLPAYSAAGSNPTPNTSAAYTPPANKELNTLTPSGSQSGRQSLTGSSYANDPNFLNATPEERLAAIKSDPALARQEIARDKQMYMDVMNAKDGDPILNGMSKQDRLDQIHQWADQVRSTASIPEDDSVYGNKDNSAPLVQSGGAQPNPNTTQGQQQQQQQPNQMGDLYNNWQSMMNASMNPNDPYWNPTHQAAESKAAQIVQDKQMQLDNARQGLDDKYFKQYLSSRQNLANRGVGNSGIANDADFRLQLAKQGDLGNMFAQLGTFNKDQIASDEFQKMYADASKNMMQGANSMSQMYGNLMNNQYNYDKMASDERQFYSKLDVEHQDSMAKIGFDYANLNSQEKQFFSKLNQDGMIEAAKLKVQWAQYGLDVTKVMGVDADGNITLDAKQLGETVRSHNMDFTIGEDRITADVSHWKMEDDNADSDRALRGKDLDEKTEYDKQMLRKMEQQADNDTAKTLLGVLGKQQSEIVDTIKARLAADPKANVDDLWKKYTETTQAAKDFYPKG